MNRRPAQAPPDAYDIKIMWEDPPQSTSYQRAAEYNRLVFDQLRANPGRWARVSSFAQAGNAGTWARWGCEVRRARIRGSICHIWARWPGDLS